MHDAIISLVTKAAVALSATLVPVAIAKAVSLVNALIAKIHSDVLRAYAQTAVAGIEQKFAKTISNSEKKAKVVALLEAKFPHVPAEIIDSVVEAAVAALPASA